MSAMNKSELRKIAKVAREALVDRPARSQRIFAHLAQCAEFRTANTILFYVAARSEVETAGELEKELAQGRRIAVPYCVGEELRLFSLRDMSELVPGAFRILEPPAELRLLAERMVPPAHVDLALVPGVVFDKQGNRLGYGRGFYDRLLRQLSPSALRIGLAFDCQVVEQLPVEPHDERLDWLVTETGVRRMSKRPSYTTGGKE